MENHLDITYAYSNSRLRAVEKNLLDKVKQERLLDAKNVLECQKLLLDIGWGNAGIEYQYYEQLLKDEMAKAFTFIKSIAPDKSVFDVFSIKNDYHNIKVLLKSEFLKNAYDHLLLTSGNYSVDFLKNVFRDRRFDVFSKTMQNAISECYDIFAKTADAQMVDIILDKGEFVETTERIKACSSDYSNNLIQTLSDFTNIRMFVRIKRIPRLVGLIDKILLTGGIIPKKIFIANIGLEYDNFLQAIRHTPYSNVVSEGISSMAENGNLSLFEKSLDNYFVQLLRKAKYIPFGIEPLIAYIYAKENEIKNVRIILGGIEGKVDTLKIKERLRDLY